MSCNHSTSITFRKATKSGGNDTGPNCVEVGEFFKATDSNPSGNCVETAFFKATRSGPSNACVEVAHAAASKSNGNGGNNCVEPGLAVPNDHTPTCTPETCTTPGIEPGDVVVRDSKLGDSSPLLIFSARQWKAYVGVVIEAGMELEGSDFILRSPHNPGITLRFTPDEADAFRDGCIKGEFNYTPVTFSA